MVFLLINFLLCFVLCLISNNCTYIQNPGYPSAYTTAGSCQYSVAPINSDICQLRLDLDVFDIAETTTTGACVDTFDVTTGSSRDYYALCGTLTGQHCKYIPFYGKMSSCFELISLFNF